MPDQIDLQAIDRGLGALAGLLQNADVRATVAVFRADFLAASQQIDVLSDHKDLHDQLHDLQFKCYNEIDQQATRFPGDDQAREILLDHELTLREITAKLQEIMVRPAVSGEFAWVAELAAAGALLHQALDGSDPAALKRCCRLIKRVLDRYPSLINARLNAAAKSLRMEAIEQAIASILVILRVNSPSSPDTQAFDAGRASLAELNRRLTGLVRDHDRWQDLDVELRRVQAALISDPEELELSWPDIKAHVTPLMSGGNEGSIQDLQSEGNKLADALVAGDPVQARRSFKRFHRHAARRFYEVDDELKMLCSQLRKLGAPLAAAAQLIAAVVPAQFTSPAGVEPLAATATQREHYLREQAELSRKYDALTAQIGALDEDIGRTSDGELRLVLKRRRDERAAERDKLVAIRTQIEVQLACAMTE